MQPDVIVVGAGPSGSTAALTLARSGARVLLIEKSALPREKACGDGLVPRAVSTLRRLGVDLEDGPSIESAQVRSVESWTSVAEFHYPGCKGAVIPRSILDERLASLAVAAGANLHTKTEASELLVEQGIVRGVRLRTRAGVSDVVHAPVTILAAGSASVLTRQAPIVPNEDIGSGFAIRGYLEGVQWDGPPKFEVYLPLELEGLPVVGYGWIFPVAGDGANVGVCHFAIGQQRPQLRSLYSAFMRQLRRRDPRFAGAQPAARLLGALMRTGGRGTSSFGPGVLLVGDSAGLVNPFSGEGISAALESGELAAETCLGFLAGEAPLSSYGDSIRNRRLRDGRLGSALPVLYPALRHVAREVIPFQTGGGPLARAALAAFTADQYDRPRPATPHRPAARARAVGLRLAARERIAFDKLIGELSELDEVQAPVAEAFFVAAERAGVPTDTRECRRAAACLELFRIACCLLDEVDRVGPGPPGPRGAGWLCASLGIGLADRLLARCFGLLSRLPTAHAIPVSDALLDVLDHLMDRIGSPPDAAHRRSILVEAATRAGQRLT